MSFGFQFDEEDLDDEYRSSASVAKGKVEQTGADHSGPSVPKTRTPAKRHTLQELLVALPSRLSYSTLTIPIQDSSIRIPRRDLFDARFQLINEDDSDEGSNTNGDTKEEKAKKLTDWETYSAGADTDLIPGVYEGGFKTWECSLDLTTKLHNLLHEEKDSSSWLQNKRITELGCGTAIPSMYLFSRLLTTDSLTKRNCSFALCDFNEQVLRLVTFPNMLLTWFFNSSKDRVLEDNGDVEVTQDVLDEFSLALTALDIRIDLFSGPWHGLHDAGAFDCTRTTCNVVLTSETIYSIESLPVLVETLGVACSGSIIAILQKTTLAETKGRAEVTTKQDLCLVAAKVLYFGVGGGVNAFQEELAKHKASSTVVWRSERGVARIILQVHFS
ncbi:hypothetical protein CBS101457_001147 [Exobasidium rhododendri]|nr:hypothetical protein CBS101457_001147 [Exobasidium rhododendri]